MHEWMLHISKTHTLCPVNRTIGDKTQTEWWWFLCSTHGVGHWLAWYWMTMPYCENPIPITHTHAPIKSEINIKEAINSWNCSIYESEFSTNQTLDFPELDSIVRSFQVIASKRLFVLLFGDCSWNVNKKRIQEKKTVSNLIIVSGRP